MRYRESKFLFLGQTGNPYSFIFLFLNLIFCSVIRSDWLPFGIRQRLYNAPTPFIVAATTPHKRRNREVGAPHHSKSREPHTQRKSAWQHCESENGRLGYCCARWRWRRPKSPSRPPRTSQTTPHSLPQSRNLCSPFWSSRHRCRWTCCTSPTPSFSISSSVFFSFPFPTMLHITITLRLISR